MLCFHWFYHLGDPSKLYCQQLQYSGVGGGVGTDCAADKGGTSGGDDGDWEG